MGCNSSSSNNATVKPSDVQRPEETSRPAVPAVKQLSSQSHTQSQSNFHEQYKVLNKLGKGAFAQVYAAKQIPDPSKRAIDVNICVKVTDLRVRKDGECLNQVDEKATRQCKKEVMLLRRLGSKERSDKIIRVFEEFYEDCLSYMVMEKCDMSLLAALDRATDLSESTMVEFFEQFFEGIAACHRVNIVHRDIKPDNFLCTRAANDGQCPIVKTCDFGMAELLNDSHQSLKGVYGTAPFMSPEMLGSNCYGTKTDVWSVWAMCYVLMVGKFPYQPVQSTPKAMKAAIVAGQPEPSFQPSQSLPPISDHAASMLQKLFHRDPNKRPTAQDAVQMMKEFSATSNKWGSKSLRPMIHSAKRVGAFDTRRVKENENDVDSIVRGLQARYHSSETPDDGDKDASACRSSSDSGNRKGSPAATMSQGTTRVGDSVSDPAPSLQSGSNRDM